MKENTTAPLPAPKQKKQNAAKIKFYIFLALGLALILTGLFADHLAPYDPYLQDHGKSLLSPSFEHPFGTDRYGRDLFSRVIAGARTSILSTLTLVLIVSSFGTLLGICSAYLGEVFDSIIMRISDICLAFPGLVFSMAIAAVLQGGVHNAIIALAAISWPKYSRIARGLTLTIKNSDFIMASQLAGSSVFKIILVHILPNIIGPLMVTAVADIGTMMMEIAALSFLGLGAKPPIAEWGSMMSSGRSMLQTYPWVVLSPGFAIFISVVIFNLLGDAARDYFDPQNKPSA